MQIDRRETRGYRSVRIASVEGKSGVMGNERIRFVSCLVSMDYESKLLTKKGSNSPGTSVRRGRGIPGTESHRHRTMATYPES